ncbi:MAG: hypothetical protein EA351_01305 [Gemmatimonadales bacterium]|nr:MAG: hypothetical protein EA351_01305 [Gemmatimonadales bacterium]
MAYLRVQDQIERTGLVLTNPEPAPEFTFRPAAPSTDRIRRGGERRRPATCVQGRRRLVEFVSRRS